MRWLFLLLLVLNVTYLAWELNREHAQTAVPNTLPKGVERIVLLRELEPEKPLNEEAVAQVASAEPAITGAVQAPVSESSDTDTASLDKLEAKKTDTQTAQATPPENSAVVEDGVQADNEDVVSAAMFAEKTVQVPVAKPKDDLC